MKALLVTALLVAAGCDGASDKKPVSAPLERSQIVEAKAEVEAKANPPVQPVASSQARPPRAICAGQMGSPGRAAPKKALSQAGASGEPALPSALPLSGGYTWVNFWAAWCAPCKEEIPRLFHFQRELAKISPGFTLGFISLDDDERQLAAFLAAQPASGLRRTYWLKEGREREEWLKAAGLDLDPELPFHLLFDAKGKLRCVVKGAVEDDDLPALKRLLAN
jgi:thiol-disulfide isomerase/thioredoxin